MGTRADFYIGRGEQAEWLGSIAYDGFPEDGHPSVLRGITQEDVFRHTVRTLLASLRHATHPEHGWPWPWPNSQTTDFSYAFDAGVVYVTHFGYGWQVFLDTWTDIDENAKKVSFPDMTPQQRMTYGPRSGTIVVTDQGMVDDES